MTDTTIERTGSSEEPSEGSLDEARVEAFAGEVFGLYAGSFLTFMIDLGFRTGLLEAAARGPASSAELAARADVQERYVREWAAALVTGGILTYDPADGTYRLPAEHAACLTGRGGGNLAPLSQLTAVLGTQLPAVAEAFREGGGVPSSAFRPAFTDMMDSILRGMFDELLISSLLPLTGALPAGLAGGIRVADLGCGTGHPTNLMAAAYPASRFVGYDLAPDAISRAREEARELGLTNIDFEVRDVATLPASGELDAVVAFDTIHDLARPVETLQRVREALTPGGWFVMFDFKVASALEGNVGNPLAPWLYGISTLHCLTVSLAQDGAGLGTCWGEELARRMLDDAGFVDVEVHDHPTSPVDGIYVARAPG